MLLKTRQTHRILNNNPPDYPTHRHIINLLCVIYGQTINYRLIIVLNR